MKRCYTLRVSSFLAGILPAVAIWSQVASSAPPPTLPDLAEFKTVETAIRAKEVKPVARHTVQPPYLGIAVAPHKNGLVVQEVEPNSPAATSGILVGDIISAVAGKRPKNSAELRDVIQAYSPKDQIKLRVNTGRRGRDVEVALGSASRPRAMNEDRAVLGIQLGEPAEAGIPIRRVTENSPAAKVGLKQGDLVLKVDGTSLTDAGRLDNLLNEKTPGDTITITYKRDDKEAEAKATLEANPTANNANSNFNFVARNVFKKDVYRLAIIPIEYPDVKHNEKIGLKDWEEELFSKGTFKDKQNATGQQAYGSLNDHYIEQSNGAFRIEGKVFDWVLVDKNRADYSPGSGTGIPQAQRVALLTEAIDKLLKRDGDKALEGYDGIFFLYAGGRVQTSRGSLYWPHRSSVRHGGKTWPYFIIQEGGQRMTDISVMGHEFGHLIGLPDLYARPENPGSEGLWQWCLMSNQIGNGRPQHMSAWCKEQMGWLKPAVIDPTVPQKLILGPINGSSTECYKVLLRPDGSEYLLLENRRKIGFDTGLPAEGLLIWRIVGTRPMLEESHGVEGPSGPASFPTMVPYPSQANNAFTQFTKPSSKAQLGGGYNVMITNIQQLPDGRITFYIGYDFN